MRFFLTFLLVNGFFPVLAEAQHKTSCRTGENPLIVMAPWKFDQLWLGDGSPEGKILTFSEPTTSTSLCKKEEDEVQVRSILDQEWYEMVIGPDDKIYFSTTH